MNLHLSPRQGRLLNFALALAILAAVLFVVFHDARDARGAAASATQRRGKVLVGNTATTIYSGQWRKLTVRNNDSAETIYLQWTTETDDLATTNGFPLRAGETIGLFNDPNTPRSDVQGIAATASTFDVRFVADQ